MDIYVKEVTNLRELRAFVRFPNELYRDNPYWVPQLFMDDYQTLRRDKNPAFDYCEAKYWLAYRSGSGSDRARIVGRIAGIYNHAHVEQWGQPYLRFGWIDFVDDPAVSEALLGAVEAWAREEGLTAVHGPLGFTDMDHEGMLIEGFDELGTLAAIYNYPYYPAHMERLGYEKDVDWVEYEITVPSEPHAKISRIADLALRRYKLRKLEIQSKKELRSYIPEAFVIVNAAYKDLYGFVPLTDRQIEHYVAQYFGFVSPEFVPVVVDEDGRMVGFGLTMPSLSRALQRAGGRLLPFGFLHLLRALNKPERADLYLVAVRPDFQGKGVNAILMDAISKVYARLGITKAESNPELETNQDVQGQWKYYETRQHKRRRCFIKYLE